MKRVVLIAAACVALSGCAGLNAAVQPGGLGEKVLDDLKYCKREYEGALGAGLTGSFRIQCDPLPPPAPSPPPGGT